MSQGLSPEVIMALIFIAVLIVSGCIYAAFATFASPDRGKERRIAKIQQRWSPNHRAPASAQMRRIALQNSKTGLEAFIRQYIPRPAELRNRLNRTGRNISLVKYVASNVIVFAVIFLILRFVANYGTLISLLVGLFLGIGGPHYFIGTLVKKRQNRFIKLFPEAIDLMVRGLKSGLPITESILSVGNEVADPVGVEFRHVGETVKLGKTLDDALWAMAKIMSVQEFNFFVISLSVQRETGGNLAETFENLSNILRRRQQMKLKVKAMSSEAKASAYIIGSLPFLVFSVLLFINYDYASTLFTDPRGMMMAVTGLFFMATGVAVIAKMIRFEI